MATENRKFIGVDGETHVTAFSNPQVGQSPDSRLYKPEQMSMPEFAYWASYMAKEQEQRIDCAATIPAFPYDAAFAVQRAAQRTFGVYKIEDPSLVNIPVDAFGGTAEVNLGSFSVPQAGENIFGMSPNWAQNTLTLNANLQRKFKQPVFDRLVAEAIKIAKEESIYKGKAIEVTYDYNLGRFNPPAFMPIRAGENVPLICSREVEALIEASLYSLVRNPHHYRNHGIPVRAGFLFYGPYGTGKTQLARKLASLCQGPWTLVNCKNVQDLPLVYEFARQFAPQVFVFVEDLDLITSDDQKAQAFSSILDGIKGKGDEIVLIATTNHIENIQPVILRQGRIDHIIHMALPDKYAAIELIKLYAGSALAPDFDFDSAGSTLRGNTPAAIRTILELAKKFSLAGQDGSIAKPAIRLTSDAVIMAATGQQEHIKLATRKKPIPPSALEKAAAVVGNVLVSALDNAGSLSRPVNRVGTAILNGELAGDED